jgi:hypothetical protein
MKSFSKENIVKRALEPKRCIIEIIKIQLQVKAFAFAFKT